MADQRLSIKWLPEPEDHDYPSAVSYLSLIYTPEEAKDIAVRLRETPVEQFKSKDIFRASRLSLLGISNVHVKRVQKKIRRGIALSPLLLLRDPANGNVIVADGYHRLCAVYSFNEDAWIPCKIVSR
jgi:hypothetical protein